MFGFGQIGFLAIGQLPPRQNPGASSTWQKPVTHVLAAAILATTWHGFVAPPTVRTAPPFTKFSQPSKIRANLEGWRNAPLFQAARAPVFSKFSTPLINRINLPDERTSTLFEVEPPQPPPFAGFARFTDFLIAKTAARLSPAFIFNPITFPVDTHDGGWVKKRKKGKDPLELKIEEERSRRAALELAIYGPEVEYKIEIPKFDIPKPPADIGDLPQIIASVRHKNYMDELMRGQDEDEDELNMILKDIV